MRDVKRVLEMRSQNHSQRDIARATKYQEIQLEKYSMPLTLKKSVGHLFKILVNTMSKNYCSKKR